MLVGAKYAAELLSPCGVCAPSPLTRGADRLQNPPVRSFNELLVHGRVQSEGTERIDIG